MMQHQGWRALFVAALLVSGPWACSDDEESADAGAVDSGAQSDSGPRADAAAADSGALDAGSADSGSTDAEVARLTAVAVAPSAVTLKPGESEQLSVTGTFSDGTMQELTAGVSWRSSSTDRATVSEGGVVTAVSVGSAEIIATVSGVSGSATITIAEEPATTREVFGDDYGPDVAFSPFGGSTNAVTVDTSQAREGSASLRIEVPAAGYTGGALAVPGGIDLSAFNALTFWARASGDFVLNVSGIGNNAASNALQVERNGLPLTSTWTRFVIPIPNPAVLTSEAGLFHFAEGAEAAPYTIWLDAVRYELLPAAELGAPAPAIATESVTREAGSTFGINGSSVTYELGGQPATLSIARRYLSWTSSDAQVATVDADGVVTARAPGSADITAALGQVVAAGITSVTVTPSLQPLLAAPAPTHAAADVISLYSNAYPSVPVDTWSAVWDLADVSDETVAGDDVKRYTNLVFAGIEFTSNTIDATGMTHFSLDVWTPAGSTLTVKLVDFGADGAYAGGDDTEHELAFNASSTPALTLGTWVRLDLPLASFANLAARGHLAQLILAGSPGTVYVDNVYFHR
jgi:hypothetical protein